MTTAIEYFRSAISEQRTIQGAWSHVENGKHYVCLAAAWGKPGTINSVDDCPVNLFPRWVFELMPTLDDGVATREVLWLFHGFSDRAETMAAFTPEQWDGIRTSFMIGLIDMALDYARPIQPKPLPAYWERVELACQQVKTALMTGDKARAAAEAAAGAAGASWATRATGATRAAEAAARAARAAAEAAAGAAGASWAARAARAAGASWAARAAAGAAAGAAGASWATRATGAAYKSIASLFFACVDTVPTEPQP